MKNHLLEKLHPNNILLRMFRHSIAPQAGNLDEMRGALVNLMAHAHSVFIAGQSHEGGVIDVMYYIQHEMFSSIVEKNSPPYAPYVMRLILAKDPGTPLLTTNLVTPKHAKLQMKNPPPLRLPVVIQTVVSHLMQVMKNKKKRKLSVAPA